MSALDKKAEEDLPAIEVYSVGICHASACVRKGVSSEELEHYMALNHPTGISSGWEISDEAFSTGEPNPNPCKTVAGRVHYLLEC